MSHTQFKSRLGVGEDDDDAYADDGSVRSNAEIDVVADDDCSTAFTWVGLDRRRFFKIVHLLFLKVFVRE